MLPLHSELKHGIIKFKLSPVELQSFNEHITVSGSKVHGLILIVVTTLLLTTGTDRWHLQNYFFGFLYHYTWRLVKKLRFDFSSNKIITLYCVYWINNKLTLTIFQKLVTLSLSYWFVCIHQIIKYLFNESNIMQFISTYVIYIPKFHLNVFPYTFLNS